MFTRVHFTALIGPRYGPIIFHRLAAQEGPQMRKMILAASIEAGPIEVLKRLDKERTYLPNGKVLWDAAEHLN